MVHDPLVNPNIDKHYTYCIILYLYEKVRGFLSFKDRGCRTQGVHFSLLLSTEVYVITYERRLPDSRWQSDGFSVHAEVVRSY